MIILGLSDSHEAQACILRDGEVIAAIAEERLSRLKADMSYPRRAIDKVLEIAGCRGEDVDYVSVSDQCGNPFQKMYKKQALLKVDDWVRQMHDHWKPVLLEGKTRTWLDEFRLFESLRGEELKKDPYFPFVELAHKIDASEWSEAFNALRRKVIAEQIGISEDRVLFQRHEDCHKHYGLWSAPFRTNKALILTVEGKGDDSSATVSTYDDGEVTEHWRSNDVMLGRLYRYVTLILGMLPGQHEYKVMGLAPFGTRYHGNKSLEVFRNVNVVDGIEIKNTKHFKDLYFSIKDEIEGQRFDGIAWGLQTYLEEILCEWIENCVDHFGIHDVIMSGGVAQNIKACKIVSELEGVQNFWVGPVSGDGSLGIGAAYKASLERDPQTPLQTLKTVYLGSEYDDACIEREIDAYGLADKYDLHRNPSAEQVAEWLDEGRIISRYSGQMEFGQRALGNRSILADPRDWSSVERINTKVKYRDFWMPFTPSFLYEDVEDYIENPKNLYSPFMTMAFDLKKGIAKSIPAVIHPADKTVRPQMLIRKNNPKYYDIIKAFKDRTGIPCVLNTSFNLHGDAIVESPKDAIETFGRSELDILLFDDVAILRPFSGE
jgi:carbamoyltransferase